VVKVAESGISSATDAVKLWNYGFNGFLIGELFMRATDPAKKCHRFVETFIALITKTSYLVNGD